MLASTQLDFADEVSVSANMTRSFDRGQRGERVIVRGPFAAGKTLTFADALR